MLFRVASRFLRGFEHGAALNWLCALHGRIRQLFVEDPELKVSFTDLAHVAQMAPPVCAGVVAASINERFLRWEDDALTRVDIPVDKPKRRTA